MNKKRIYLGLILGALMAVFLPTSKKIYASSHLHKTIRVGLRSGYANVKSVTINNDRLDIGYSAGASFQKVDTLGSSSSYKIVPASGAYYETREMFYSYTEAESSLRNYKDGNTKALVGYKYPDKWTIYLTDRNEETLDKAIINEGIEVQDKAGNTIFFADYKDGLPAFNGNFTKIGSNEYRGWFEFPRKSNTITAVNIVDVEEYLYGVVPAEMPPSWHMEALKAQALAARSMSMYQYNKYIKDGYNVCDTVYTQVYRGYTGEKDRTNQAVDATRGQLVTYKDKLAETVFYSTSGGYTEDPKYVWGNTVDYLKSIPDPYEIEPELKPWKRTISLDDLDKSLARDGANIGKAKGMRINSFTPAGRVMELEIIGESGSHKLTREKIRTFFSPTKEGSLRSRMFIIEDGQTSGRPEETGASSLLVNGDNYIDLLDMYILDSEKTSKNQARQISVQGAESSMTYGAESSPGSSTITKYGDILISGKGYGHGVGMSQSGAKGMAMQGHNYEDIIKYYYQGVEISK